MRILVCKAITSILLKVITYILYINWSSIVIYFFFLVVVLVKSQEVLKPNTLDESINYKSEIDNESYFFSYFMVLCLIFIVGYVGYHNKQKVNYYNFIGKQSIGDLTLHIFFLDISFGSGGSSRPKSISK